MGEIAWRTGNFAAQGRRVIAGAFARSNADRAERRLQRIDAEGGKPVVARLRGARASLLAAGAPTIAHADRSRRAVWEGPQRRLTSETLGDTVFGLVGDFSLIATDGDDAILARGIFGGRPLYFAHELDGTLVVCSRLAVLRASLDAQTPVRPEELAHRMLYQFEEDDARTTYAGISRVRTGEILRFRSGRLVERQLIPFRASSAGCRTPCEYADELRSRIIAAVARATDGEERVGLMLSGGVDSSTVLAALLANERDVARREIVAVSLDVAPTPPFGEDRIHLDAVVDSFGVVPVRITPRECVDHVEHVFAMDAASCVHAGYPANRALSVAAHTRGARRILTGAGGDDLFDFDPRALPAMARRGQPLRSALVAAKMRAVYWQSTRLERVVSHVAKPLIRAALPPRSLQVYRGILRPRPRTPIWMGDVLGAVFERASVPEPQIEEAVPTSRGRLTMTAYSRGLTWISDLRAQLEDSTDTERIDIFWDHGVASFAASIPPDLLTYGGFLRGLLRHAFRGEVPAAARLRQDKGGWGPAYGEILGALRGPRLSALLSMEESGAVGLVRPEAFRAEFADVLADPTVTSVPKGERVLSMWAALAVEGFLRAERAGFRANEAA